MGIFVLTATYELRVSRKSHLRDHPMTYPARQATYTGGIDPEESNSGLRKRIQIQTLAHRSCGVAVWTV
jgi:hypothetical protein